MTELLPSPRWSVTESYEPGNRQRIAALSETNRAVTAENVALHRALAELERRVARVVEICEYRRCDHLPQRILRVLDGDPHEFPGRCAE